MSNSEKQEKIVNSRSGIGFSVTLQIVAVLVIVLGINIIGFNYYDRQDFSRSQKFTLSDQTRGLVRQVKKPLKVIIYFSPTSTTPDVALASDVKNFIDEVQFAMRKNMTVEVVKPALDLNRVRELQAQYNFGASENVIILDYDGHTQFIPVSHMALWDQSQVPMGEPPRILAFIGEQEFTAALLELLKPDDRKVYFLQGDGEPDFTQAPELSLLREYIARQSIKALPLDISKTGELPQDAGVLVLVGPRYDPLDAYLQLLEKFWQKDGSILIYLDPNANTPKLSAFLEAHAIRPVNDRVLTTVNIAYLNQIGIVRDVRARFIPESPATRRLEGVTALFQGATQTLDLQWPLASKAKITLRPLIMASDEFWGETDYVTDEKKGVKFDEGVDVKAPVTIAASAEKGGVEDENVTLRSAKLIVVGNKDCLLNEALDLRNLDFFLNSLNWMLDRGKLSGIAPKNIHKFSLVLTESQTASIAFYTMIVIPGLVALAGIIAWWRRRK
ncbi:MAG: Gldg family protein [Chthoniobacterales bacterium]